MHDSRVDISAKVCAHERTMCAKRATLDPGKPPEESTSHYLSRCIPSTLHELSRVELLTRSTNDRHARS